MNPIDIFSEQDINKIKSIGIELENKNYTPAEYRLIESKIEDYIMSNSTKNGEIMKLSNEFNNILITLIKIQK